MLKNNDFAIKFTIISTTHMKGLIVRPTSLQCDFLKCLQALETRGTKVKYIEVADSDHFTVVENMLQPEYQLTQV